MSDWANVATLGKAKNLKGGILAYPREGLSFLLQEGMEVVFVPPVLRAPRSGRVVSVAPVSGSGAKEAFLVQFDSLDSIDMAEKFQDHSCLVRKADLPEDYDRSLLSLVGFQVLDVKGDPIGTVVEIQENPAHPLLVVDRASEEGECQQPEEDLRSDQGARSSVRDASKPNEVLVHVPLVEDFIVAIDEDAQTITMALPEGLFDL